MVPLMAGGFAAAELVKHRTLWLKQCRWVDATVGEMPGPRRGTQRRRLFEYWPLCGRRACRGAIPLKGGAEDDVVPARTEISPRRLSIEKCRVIADAVHRGCHHRQTRSGRIAARIVPSPTGIGSTPGLRAARCVAVERGCK